MEFSLKSANHSDVCTVSTYMTFQCFTITGFICICPLKIKKYAYICHSHVQFALLFMDF